MTDGRVPMELTWPPFTWNITEALIQNLKKLLLEIESNWKPLGKCGNSRIYLPELWPKMSMKNVREQVTALIDPFVKNHISGRYKSLTYYQVGALRSKGEETQLECVGSLHCDYHDNVNNRVSEKRPMSIILALDPFYFLYEKTCGVGMSRVIEQHVPSSHAVLFTSGLNHAGSVTNKYNYRLFAYIVSDEVDNPSEVATRIKIPNNISIGSADEETN
jgi:hypothetical protein